MEWEFQLNKRSSKKTTGISGQSFAAWNKDKAGGAH